MKLRRRQSCGSRLMLRARCRCAPRAEEAKIFAGPHVCLKTCILRAEEEPRDVKRVTGAENQLFNLVRCLAACRLPYLQGVRGLRGTAGPRDRGARGTAVDRGG
eukprot:4997832-Prymnesium_polylepis.1